MFPDLFRDDVFTLETQRLFLRWPKAADQAALVAEAGDRRVAEPHAVIPYPYRPDHALQFVAEARSTNTEGRGVYLAIATRRDPDRLIGVISLRHRADGEVSLGYWLGVPHWGKGYATEAAHSILDAGFLYSDVGSIIAGVRVTNDRSRRVLERCGFQYIGSGMSDRPAWGDRVSTDSYRLSRGTWASLKGWRAPLPLDLRESA